MCHRCKSCHPSLNRKESGETYSSFSLIRSWYSQLLWHSVKIALPLVRKLKLLSVIQLIVELSSSDIRVKTKNKKLHHFLCLWVVLFICHYLQRSNVNTQKNFACIFNVLTLQCVWSWFTFYIWNFPSYY